MEMLMECGIKVCRMRFDVYILAILLHVMAIRYTQCNLCVFLSECHYSWMGFLI